MWNSQEYYDNWKLVPFKELKAEIKKKKLIVSIQTNKTLDWEKLDILETILKDRTI